MEFENQIDSVVFREKEYQFTIKRGLDIVISLIGIIMLLPLFVIIPILIKIDSDGPIIFRQIRVGKDGKNFVIYKFRTMVSDADIKKEIEIPENIEDFVIQEKNDIRITKLGELLRRSSLDEIPQLFNVLIGNMSIVGPRPEVPGIVKYFPEKYKQRVLVLPGITGLAQINGRGELPLKKKVEYDLEYIQNFTVLLDIKIILKTIRYVLQQEGAL
ncbi:exopolysaccharide biosynthesis polyprenyl glycosylphosphotransferase [Clostridium sediminicola]|uniref:sugar transferase n=1 Tax=Clostridium sediminicola TaxID=3114879 RepID=UPI0031F1F0BB